MEFLLPNSLSKNRSPRWSICARCGPPRSPESVPPVPFRDRDRSPGPTGGPPRSPGPRPRSLGPIDGPFAVPRSHLRSVCGNCGNCGPPNRSPGPVPRPGSVPRSHWETAPVPRSPPAVPRSQSRSVCGPPVPFAVRLRSPRACAGVKFSLFDSF